MYGSGGFNSDSLGFGHASLFSGNIALELVFDLLDLSCVVGYLVLLQLLAFAELILLLRQCSNVVLNGREFSVAADVACFSASETADAAFVSQSVTPLPAEVAVWIGVGQGIWLPLAAFA